MTTDAALVLSTVPTALLFAGAGAGKLAGAGPSLEMRDHLDIDAARWRGIGGLEVAAVTGVLLGLAVRPLGIAAAAGLALLSTGALAAHVGAGDPPAKAAPALVALALSVTTLALRVAA
jgi:uncharacterized membrane protein YphA (DoxX/SURF4 family)